MRDAGARLRDAATAVANADPASRSLPGLIRPALDALETAAALAIVSPSEARAHLLLARASITEALNTHNAPSLR